MRKLILKSGFSPGDIVMMTAAVRDLHRGYPGAFATDVRTSCPELWEHNPHLTPLAEEDPQVEGIECAYPLINYANERPYHCLHGYMDFLNQRLGLAIRPTQYHGDLHLSEREKSWYSQVREVTGRAIPFWILVAGGKYDVPVKWWDAARYQAVVDHFRGKIQFVQVGEFGHHHPRLAGVIDLRGQTNLRELVRLVYHAQGVLCSVTAAMHLAAAVEVKAGQPGPRPCVVVAGGREPAHWEAYPGHQFIHTLGALACCAGGGCWRDRVRPLGDGDNCVRVGAYWTGASAYEVAVAGNYAYVAASSSGLQVFDVSDPVNCVRVGGYTQPKLYAYHIVVAENVAYVTDCYGGFVVVDVRDPAHCVRVGSDSRGKTLAVAGTYAYVGDDFGVQVLDASNPAQCVRVGAYQGNSYGVAVAGNFAYVADGAAGLQVIDVRDPHDPRRVGGYDTSGRALGVAVAGSYAFVADGAAGLEVIDVRDPTRCVRVGGCVTDRGWAYGVAVAGNYAYLAAGTAGLQVMDVRNPSQPVRMGGYGADAPGDTCHCELSRSALGRAQQRRRTHRRAFRDHHRFHRRAASAAPTPRSRLSHQRRRPETHATSPILDCSRRRSGGGGVCAVPTP